MDLDDELYGEVFGPLRDEAAFAEVYVDPETRTIIGSSWRDEVRKHKDSANPEDV